MRGATPFAMIALVAGTDDILPNRCAALGAGNDMIEIELLARQPPTAVLASALIAGVDVIAAKTDLSLGHPVVSDEQNHPRYPDYSVD